MKALTWRGVNVLPLDEGPRGYAMVANKRDGCVHAVFQPGR